MRFYKDDHPGLSLRAGPIGRCYLPPVRGIYAMGLPRQRTDEQRRGEKETTERLEVLTADRPSVSQILCCA